MTTHVDMKNNTQITKDLKRSKAYFEAKMGFTTGPVELERMMKSENNDFIVVDVRASEDYEEGHIPGAINLPKEKWDACEGLERDKINVLYCYSQVCHLAATAALEFIDKGYAVMELEGGFQTWKDLEMEIEKQPHRRFEHVH